MLRDADSFRHVYIACGRTDLRRGMDSLLCLIRNEFRLDPFAEGAIFLFCGSRLDRMKALVFEGDGVVLMTKRLSKGRFQWPRDRTEMLDITMEQYRQLMDGFAIEYRSTIEKVKPGLV